MTIFKSLKWRRWGTALATLALAFTSGYVMQNRLSDRAPVESTQLAAFGPATDQPKALPSQPTATRLLTLDRPPVLADRVDEPLTGKEADPGCAPTLSVSAAPAATLRITLTAPCHGDTRVFVQQGDMAASFQTGGDGVLNMRVPALTTNPVIQAAIAGKQLSATVEIPDAGDFQHVALQWSGRQALRINAYEFGAQKSQFGHVWSGAPKSPSRASRGSGGFLTKLGDGRGKSAEIYSFPVGQASSRGVVRLVVEAEVTKQNCGQKIQATALQTSPLGHLSPTEISLTMPDCDQVGEIVRLQNLLQDMRLASR